MLMMKASVIITSYNRPNKLIRAFRSVIGQKVYPNEIVIVDDNSNFRISKDMFGVIPKAINLRIIKNKKNMGGNYSRNIGIKKSKHDIIMFLDDDDQWGSEKILKQTEKLKNDKVGLVYCDKLMYNEKNKRVTRRKKCYKSGKLYPDIFYTNFIGTTSSVAVKKKVLEVTGLFDNNLPAMQDYDLWIRVANETMVDYVNCRGVLYSCGEYNNDKVMKQSWKHEKAANILIDKYIGNNKYEEIDINKFKAHLYYIVAKATNRKDIKSKFKWISKSISCYPNFKSLTTLFR